MDIHYNAFISYRHHPDDIRVATDIHRSLERLRIPKDLRKKVSGIERIFRDKEELPITSSLTDTIYNALENSDFLIVICSVHVKQSIWVQREIETFLKTHHRSRVLTVLASGEPYDVIPEILLHEDVTDPETGETRRIDYEPLSCDWRLGRKQAMREELPRLAAALLGCGYDELRQRQRQYRLKRTAIALGTTAVAAVGLAGYFLYTGLQIQKANDNLHAANQEISRKNEELNTANDQIRDQNTALEQANDQITENLEQALRNQSRYLASTAQDRLAAGDRLTAMTLALAGLPEKQERPYEPAAEFALSQALAAYQADQNLKALAAFGTDSMVEGFEVAQDGRSMFMLDARDIISGWDTVTFRQTCAIDGAALDPQGVFMTPQGNVCFRSGTGEYILSCYSPAGELLWTCPGVLSAAWVADRSYMAVLQTDFSKEYAVLLLDPTTGQPVGTGARFPREYDDMTISAFTQLDCPAGRPLALRAGGSGRSGLVLADPETGTLTGLTAFEDPRTVQTASVTADGRVLVMVSDGSGEYNGDYGNFQITGPARRELYCYNPDGTLLWQTEMVTHTYSSVTTFRQVPGRAMAVAQTGDSFLVVDLDTGAVLHNFQTGGLPVSVEVDSTSVWGMLKNGADFSYSFSAGQCYTTPFRDGAVSLGTINRGYYAVDPLGTQVVLYRSTRDESGQVLEGAAGISSSTARARVGDDMALLYGANLYSLDLANNTQRWKLNVGYLVKMIGIRQGRIWFWRSSGNVLESYDLYTGEKQEYPVDLKKQGIIGGLVLDSQPWSDGTNLWLLGETRGLLELRRFTPEEGTRVVADLTALQSASPNVYSKETTFLHREENGLWFWRSGAVYRIDLADGTLEQILECEALPTLTSDGRGRIALCQGSTVTLTDAAGRVTGSFELEVKGVSLYFWDDWLLILGDDALLYRYDLQGSQLSRTGLQVYNTFSGNVAYPTEDPMRISWDRTDGDLVLGVFGAGNLIETDSWQVRAYIPNLTAVSMDGSWIFTRSGGQIYRYARCTTERIMERARETLGDFTLTPEQRRGYGIE